MRLAKSKVHFIGIGGIGMCGLAELLSNMGVAVQGSDIAENAQIARLRKMGIQVSIGHSAENLGAADVCVFSSAIKPQNVEYKEAKKRGTPLIPRAEALAEIMRLKRGIAIGGSHGKTTTTSMTAAILLHGQTDPTIVVGGRLDLIKSTAKLGSGDWIVAEADESDGSFNRLSPEIVVITNIDNDHLDHYKTFDNLQSAFVEFASRIPFYGVAIVCGDDPVTRELFAHFPKRILFYGFAEENDFVLTGSNSDYKVTYQGQPWTQFQLAVPGRHNGLNALAAILVAKESGLPLAQAALGIQTFVGVDRRLQMRNDSKGVVFIDDYGHHPTEIRAVIQALREKNEKQKISVLFQPHRYSRTQLCWNDFVTCFKGADDVYLLDIYPAGEAPIAGITTEKLVKEIDHPSCHHLKSKAEAVEVLSKNLGNKGIFLTLGAGDVWKLGDEVYQAI